MLIKILQDVHDIVLRLREIDCDYFVVYNSERECFEVHNYGQKNTYCLTVPYSQLDCRTVILTLKTRREFLEKILAEIDASNEKLEQENTRSVRDMSEWKAREFYDYANKHEDKKIENAYVTKWA